MVLQINPGLGRTDVVVNSFTSGISNTPEELTRTPEVSFSEMVSQPWIFLHEFESRISLEQLQGFANAHCWWQLNKEMDMVCSDMKLVDFTVMSKSRLSYEQFTIHSKPIKLEWISGVFGFPYEMESILPESMVKRLQIHFINPPQESAFRAHANLDYLHEGNINPRSFSELKSYKEDGNSSQS